MPTIVEFLDPRGETARTTESYALALNPEIPALSIGLVANTFPDCPQFMDYMEAELRTRLPAATFRRYQKLGVGVLSEPEVSSIAAECHAVVAAYGH